MIVLNGVLRAYWAKAFDGGRRFAAISTQFVSTVENTINTRMRCARAYTVRQFGAHEFDVLTSGDDQYQVIINGIASTYSFPFIPDCRYWIKSYDSPILPPRGRRKKGQPKSTRIRNVINEDAGNMRGKCSTCKQPGHYKSTCPENQQRRTERRCR
uniref:CCHC-type domain-containing protein n=1 Tax=Ananas comosus var. bracteatus TaxID=296719 RepID=A0A6V7P9E4_ANACO|nr:unnamed protein product [Ananas comosus var. bracteatus]